MNKRYPAMILLLCLLLCLCACGAETQPAAQNAPAPTSAPAPAAPTLQSVLPGSDLTPAATPEPAAPDATPNPLVEAARACIGEDLSALYKAIGEPTDSSYAPSCLNPGVGEDGELYYDGFYVATYREGERETVRDVIVDGE